MSLAIYNQSKIWYWSTTYLINRNQTKSDLLGKNPMFLSLWFYLSTSPVFRADHELKRVHHFSLSTSDRSDLLHSTWATCVCVSNTICCTCWQEGCWILDKVDIRSRTIQQKLSPALVLRDFTHNSWNSSGGIPSGTREIHYPIRSNVSCGIELLINNNHHHNTNALDITHSILVVVQNAHC